MGILLRAHTPLRLHMYIAYRRRHMSPEHPPWASAAPTRSSRPAPWTAQGTHTVNHKGALQGIAVPAPCFLLRTSPSSPRLSRTSSDQSCSSLRAVPALIRIGISNKKQTHYFNCLYFFYGNSFENDGILAEGKASLGLQGSCTAFIYRRNLPHHFDCCSLLVKHGFFSSFKDCIVFLFMFLYFFRFFD